jgi:hypothetical protein
MNTMSTLWQPRSNCGPECLPGPEPSARVSRDRWPASSP